MTTYTRAQAAAALETAHNMLDNIADADVVGYLAADTIRSIGPEPFTHERFSLAVNRAASQLDVLQQGGYENSSSLFRQNMLNLGVNVASYLLDHPGGTLDEAIADSWADLDELSFTELDKLPEGAPEPAKGTPERAAIIVATVLEWVR